MAAAPFMAEPIRTYGSRAEGGDVTRCPYVCADVLLITERMGEYDKELKIKRPVR